MCPAEEKFHAKYGIHPAESVAYAFDSDDDGVAREPVEEGCGDHGGSGDVTPLAIWTRSAHLHAGRRQPSMRRADRPDTRKRLTRRSELDKDTPRVAEGVRKRRPYEDHHRQADAGVSILQQ